MNHREIDKLIDEVVFGHVPLGKRQIAQGKVKRYKPYSSDISAAREMETELSKMESHVQLSYVSNLYEILGIPSGDMLNCEHAFKFIRATPLQRCLAALKAKGIEVGVGE